MRSLRKIFGSRMLLLALAILAQIIVLILIVGYSAKYSELVYDILRLASIILVISVINEHNNPRFLITWVAIIGIFPLIGPVAYLLLANRKVSKDLSGATFKTMNDHDNLLKRINDVNYNLNTNYKNQFNFVENTTSYVYNNNTSGHYYPCGDDFFIDFFKDLKAAEHFIFLEFFIVSDGEIWNKTKKILIEKAQSGLKVVLNCDDFGSSTLMTKNLVKELEENNISVALFNKLRPRILVTMNNRNHRKLIVVDNKVAYTGGCNLADEYANKIERFGHWRDSMLRIEGRAVWNITVMFLQIYNAINNQEYLEYEDYHLTYDKIENSSLYLPFSDSPNDNENVGRNVHLNMINSASKYLYISTPYLVLDYSLETALINARKKGVDVRILTPHIPDKFYVFALTRKGYKVLLDNGIKIYEYEPGFNHAKDILCDDEIGLVGTVNTDYRSYFMHFEDGVLFNDPKVIKEMKKSFNDGFSKSIEIDVAYLEKANIFVKIFRSLMVLLAPLM